MKREIKELIEKYQRIISILDAKLAMYEQLGSIDELSEKLNIKVEEVKPEFVEVLVEEKKPESRSILNKILENKPLISENKILNKSRVQRILEEFSK